MPAYNFDNEPTLGGALAILYRDLASLNRGLLFGICIAALEYRQQSLRRDNEPIPYTK